MFELVTALEYRHIYDFGMNEIKFKPSLTWKKPRTTSYPCNKGTRTDAMSINYFRLQIETRVILVRCSTEYPLEMMAAFSK